MEEGINFVPGEYIWIAESDDASDDRFLPEALNFGEKHEK